MTKINSGKKEFILAYGSGGLESVMVCMTASSRHARRSRELQDHISTTSRKQRVNWKRGEAP